jgi:hypothetical protein
MSCSRGLAVSLSAAQFVGMVAALVYLPYKRPLFVYTTSLSPRDALLSRNSSSFTMWFRRDDAVPYAPAYGPRAGQPAPSSAHVSEVFPFALFMLPSFVGCVHAFASARLLDAGEMGSDTPYGEHCVRDSVSWEACFWTLVCLQHAVVQCVLCSPVDSLYVAGGCFAATTLLAVFSVLASSTDAESPARSFEGPVFILLALVYLVIVSQSESALGQGGTFCTWLAHLSLNVLLVAGHLRAVDSHISCRTVLNCRWAYAVANCWLNVLLYIVY